MNGMDPNGSNQTGSDQTRLDQKGLDLDALRGRWQASQQPLNEALTLDRAAISKALAGRTAGAFRRHSQRLVPEILLATACLAALIWFTLNHWHDPIYLLAGSVFCLITAADLIVDCRHWRVLSGLDFSQSALLVQSTLERLRARRLALTQWIMLSSVLLWLPAIAVLLKALFGFDLLRSLDSSVVLINSLVGVLFVPLAILLGRFALPRFVGETGMRRFLDELVGMSWTRAQTEWQRQQDGEQALAQGIDPLLRFRCPDSCDRPVQRHPRRAMAVPHPRHRLELAVRIAAGVAHPATPAAKAHGWRHEHFATAAAAGRCGRHGRKGRPCDLDSFAAACAAIGASAGRGQPVGGSVCAAGSAGQHCGWRGRTGPLFGPVALSHW